MALNIKDPQTEQLARDVAAITGESLTGAVRVALIERKTRLVLARGDGDRTRRIMAMLEDRVWPELPAGLRGSTITRAEEDAILGYGPEGV